MQNQRNNEVPNFRFKKPSYTLRRHQLSSVLEKNLNWFSFVFSSCQKGLLFLDNASQYFRINKVTKFKTGRTFAA